MLRELELNSPFAPPATTTAKATKVARKPKVPSPGAVSAPSRDRSARLANKAAGTKAPEIDPDALKISRSEDQPRSDDDDDTQATDADAPQASTSIDFEYQATSELKDLCTRFADGRVDDCLLTIITQANPDLAGEPGIAFPPLEPKSALGATPATNLPRVATEDLVGSAAGSAVVGAVESLDANVSTKPTKSKKKLTGQARKIAKAKRFGDLEVPVGTWHARRADFHENLVHLPTMAGIFGDPKKGAYSIAVSGGYEDNVDQGESFTFTGEGGKIVDKRKKRVSMYKTKPNAPQTLTKGNMALYRSCQTGKAVRVIRGENSSWEGAPKKGYRYDGVSVVSSPPWDD